MSDDILPDDPTEPDDGPARRWADLVPEPGILAALDHAGVRPESGTQSEKRHWSELFAHACALCFAD
ncbi:MAG: hypothetical protein ACOYLX_06105, partial [Burkholderiaceae bacterium]